MPTWQPTRDALAICEEVAEKSEPSALESLAPEKLYVRNVRLTVWRRLLEHTVGRLGKEGQNDLSTLIGISAEHLNEPRFIQQEVDKYAALRAQRPADDHVIFEIARTRLLCQSMSGALYSFRLSGTPVRCDVGADRDKERSELDAACEATLLVISHPAIRELFQRHSDQLRALMQQRPKEEILAHLGEYLVRGLGMLDAKKMLPEEPKNPPSLCNILHEQFRAIASLRKLIEKLPTSVQYPFHMMRDTKRRESSEAEILARRSHFLHAFLDTTGTIDAETFSLMLYLAEGEELTEDMLHALYLRPEFWRPAA